MSPGDRIERHLMRQRGAGIRTVASSFGFSFAPVSQPVTESGPPSPRPPKVFDHSKPLPPAPQVSPDISFDSQPPEKLPSCQATEPKRTRKRHDFDDNHDTLPRSKRRRKDSFAQELKPKKPRGRPKKVEKTQGLADQGDSRCLEGDVKLASEQCQRDQSYTAQSADLVDTDELAFPFVVPVPKSGHTATSTERDHVVKPYVKDAPFAGKVDSVHKPVKTKRTRKDKSLEIDSTANAQPKNWKSSETLAKIEAVCVLPTAALGSAEVSQPSCNRRSRKCRKNADQRKGGAADDLPLPQILSNPRPNISGQDEPTFDIPVALMAIVKVTNDEHCAKLNCTRSEAVALPETGCQVASQHIATSKRSTNTKTKTLCEKEAQPSLNSTLDSLSDAVPSNILQDSCPSAERTKHPAKRRGRPPKKPMNANSKESDAPSDRSKELNKPDNAATCANRIPLTDIDGNAKKQCNSIDKSNKIVPRATRRPAGHNSPREEVASDLLREKRDVTARMQRKSRTDDMTQLQNVPKQPETQSSALSTVNKPQFKDPSMIEPAEKGLENCADHVEQRNTQDEFRIDRGGSAPRKKPKRVPMPAVVPSSNNDAPREQPVDNIEWLFAPQNGRAGPQSKSRKAKPLSKTGILSRGRNMLGMPDMDLDDLLSNIAVFAGDGRR